MLQFFLSRFIFKSVENQLQGGCSIDRHGNPYSHLITALRIMCGVFVGIFTVLYTFMILLAIFDDPGFILEDITFFSILTVAVVIIVGMGIGLLRWRCTLTEDALIVRKLWGTRRISYESLRRGALLESPAFNRMQTARLPVEGERPVKMKIMMIQGAENFLELLEKRAEISIDQSKLNLRR